MSDESIDPDRVAPTPSQVTPALHMLALSVPLMSALYGACLRQALSYHQLFHRLDPFLFRLLVGILLVLVSGQVACITAETWYILTTVINGKEDLQAQRIINACTQVSTTATALLCQGFYTERLFATSRNVIVRSLAIFFWMLAISLFIAWNVKYLLHNGPHLNGDRKYNLGAASLWALALASSFVSICLIHYAHQRRLRSSKSTPILPLSSRLFQLLSLSIQTFLLLTLNQIASAIGFTSSLSTSSNATAACVAFFFFNLFPGLSVFSIIYTLNQRSLELVKKKKYARSGKRRCSLNQRDEKKGKREMVMREKEREGEEIGTGCTAPEDDPSNWRGDHLPTSRTGSVSGAARDGLGVFDPVVGLSACGFGGPSRGGGGKRTELEEEEGDLENGIPAFLANPSNTISPSSSTSLPPPVIANLDNFDPSYSSSDSDSDSTPPPSPPLGPTQLTSLPFSSEPFDDTEIFTSGSIPFPPSHAPRRSVVENERSFREARNRGASVQIDEVGYGMNWDALEGCQEARIGPDMSRRGSRV